MSGGGARRAGGLAGLFGHAFALLGASRRLRRSLYLWLGTGLVVTDGFTAAVAMLHSPSVVLPLAALALPWWALVSAVMVGGATLLVTPDGTRVDRYGLPNGLSAVRAWSCFPLLLCATLPLPDHAGLVLWVVVGGAAGMLDYVDGVIARRIGPLTEFGGAMDPAGDASFFATAAVGNYALGIVPAWLAVLMLVRFLGPLLATPVIFLLGRRPELVHTEWGRRNTALTGLVLFVLMIVRVLGGPVWLGALVLGIPLLAPTAALHLLTLMGRAWRAPPSSVPSVGPPTGRDGGRR